MNKLGELFKFFQAHPARVLTRIDEPGLRWRSRDPEREICALCADCRMDRKDFIKAFRVQRATAAGSAASARKKDLGQASSHKDEIQRLQRQHGKIEEADRPHQLPR